MLVKANAIDTKKGVPVKIETWGDMLHVYGPDTARPMSFQGRPVVRPATRFINWLRLAMASRKPISCPYEDVGLVPSGDKWLLRIDPGWPFDEPLQFELAAEDSAILNEWNQAAVKYMRDKEVRCDLTEYGFTVSDTKTHTTRAIVTWSDVQQICAYKRDLFSYDMICLAFEKSDQTVIEIWESSAGFMDVATQMEAVYPGIPNQWYTEVMLPPFVENLMVLFCRHQQKGT